jgi:alkylation response protein AidB-like acyl-CoA dehydrogenase
VRIPPTFLTEQELALQDEIRAFLDRELPRGSYAPDLGMEGDGDPAFSRKLGAAGFLGLSIPREYGGQGRTAVERFVVVEELLRRGAPVAYHWIGERQSGPSINRFGSEEQKRRFLPMICSGEVCFVIGMSEPDSGSDLASVRTRATKVDGGWLVNGTKIWTSGAQHLGWMIALVRTSDSDVKQRGLSQLLVDLTSPGVTVQPIRFIDGSAHFNEVSLSDVFVPDDLLLGEEGQGWAQNTSELSFDSSAAAPSAGCLRTSSSRATSTAMPTTSTTTPSSSWARSSPGTGCHGSCRWRCNECSTTHARRRSSPRWPSRSGRDWSRTS